MGHKTKTKRTALTTTLGGQRLVSQEITDIRDWLRKTYGGYWGTLQQAAADIRKMEKKLLKQTREIERLEGNLRRVTRCQD